MHNLKYFILIFLVLGVFLSLTFKSISGDPGQKEIMEKYSSAGQLFESSQERGRYALIESIAKDKTFILDNFANFSLPDISYKDNHYYSVFPPGVSLLLLPAYYIGSYLNNPIIFIFAVPILVLIITSLLLFAICNRLGLSKTASYLAAIILPLATISWGYSTTIYAHIFSAFCIVAGLYFAIKSATSSFWNHFMVWALYGLSIIIDYPNAILMLPVVGYMIVSSFKRERLDFGKKKIEIFSIRMWFLYTIIPFLFLIFMLGCYNYITLGGWFELAHSYRVTEAVKGAVDYHFLISKAMDLKFTENGIYTLIFSKGRGIIFYSPILILALLGIESLYKTSSRIANTVVLTIIFNLLVYASFYDPWGGWSYGPRYLIMSMPFLALLAAMSYDRFKTKSIYVITFGLLFFASFSIALLGSLTTNLIPPFPEVGRQINFLSILPNLGQYGDNIILFNFIKQNLTLGLKEYYLAIIGLAWLSFSPIFIHQIIINIVRAFKKFRQPILRLQEREA